MRAERILPAGQWDPAAEADRVLLDFEQRYRRRIVLRTERGADLQIDLPSAVRMRDGDGLVLEDGGIVRVTAKAEALQEIRTREPAELVRIAWHLGNRHLAVQLFADCIRIRADHVIAEMVEGLGGHVTAIEAPFDPEAGAYSGGHGHQHHHHDD